MTRLLLAVALAGCATPVSEPRGDRRDLQGRSHTDRAAAAPDRNTPERYEEHITALRRRLADKGMGDLVIRVEEPFVVVGNGTEDAVARSAQTVRWAADILEQDFFAKRPTKILDVFLFADAESYYRGVEKLTGDEPGTPYGFYSRAQGGLFMNIATGGGTLVHEIVHPYVEADFPDAPAWLNEGLGSLFEQSAERDGHIVGLTNWRLAGLQNAIVGTRVPTFEKLTHLDDATFYGDDTGVHYAAARYLLYYLQEHGKLRDFYRTYRATVVRDPTGYATLVAAVGVDDMRVFEEAWKRYVIGLRYR